VWEVGLDAGGVAGEQHQPAGVGVRADEEVRQREGAGAARAPVASERLADEPNAGPRQRQAFDPSALQGALECLAGGEADGDLGVDDLVDRDLAVVDRLGEVRL
jgi:hypothetical protein